MNSYTRGIAALRRVIAAARKVFATDTPRRPAKEAPRPGHAVRVLAEMVAGIDRPHVD